MSATIKANCDSCAQEVSMSSSAFHLTVYKHTGEGYYTFFCNECHSENNKTADTHIVELLRSGGVRWTVIVVPAEALEPHDGPALKYDDVMDFVLALNRANENLIAELASKPRKQKQ